MSRSLPRVASAQCGVVTTEQATAAGWTEPGLRRAVAKGELDRLWRGVYATPVTQDREGAGHRAVQQAVGAALSHHELTVTHLAMAPLWRLPFWAANPRACATTTASSLTAAVGVHIHRCPIPVAESATYGSVATTSPARGIVDITREFGAESGLVTADAALRAGRVDHDALRAAAVRATGRPGAGAVRRVLELADHRAESVLESRSRYRIHCTDLPVPRPQAVVRDRDGRFVARVDFLWEDLGVVGEADGRAKYLRGTGRRSAEEQRREQLERLGLLHVSWGWEGLEPFAPTARRIRDALTRAASMPARRRAWRINAE